MPAMRSDLDRLLRLFADEPLDAVASIVGVTAEPGQEQPGAARVQR
jgi:hypothetical protein